ncbi:MAG: flagellar basal body L-ring protein FlgH [Sedimentisphaerales bacterium]|jgi:flagellar L-ring protein precursor FlgH
MNNKIITSFILISFVFCAVSRLQADSIWAKRDQNKKDLYADYKARHIGDVITITISEKSLVDNKQNRNLSKSTDRSINFDGQLGIVSKTPSGQVTGNYLPRMPGINMSASSSNTLDGKADYKDDRSFIDSITVVVVDIMPNNNLVVMGTRTREISGDIQVIEVSGIVRPSDIAYNNTVKSEQIANFSIITKNTGIAANFNKPGWLGKFFDTFSPF